jgi:radical SAM protein with 4Fe4S-binding SPASM domain
MITRLDKENRFISMFDADRGLYIRTGVIDENGNDTSIDPFMANFPHLIDCGIMGTCKNAHLCTVGCYQGKIKKDNMTLENYKKIVDQCKDKTYEFALGGFGSPNEHDDFIEIIKYTRENGIVPNYTTSGIELTDEQIEATKKYCGAVAVSWYKQKFTYDAIERFIKAGCTTNIHFVLGNDSIDEAINLLKTNGFPEGISAVLFLAYKPVGCLKSNNVLSYDNPKVKEFFELIDTGEFSHKIGLDACNVPGLINFSKNINKDSATPCDGGSFSMYITPDMVAIPCSFDNQKRKYGVDLNTHTIQDAWNSKEFEGFRNWHRFGCKNCDRQNDCRSGCPIVPEINLCNREEKQYYEG